MLLQSLVRYYEILSENINSDIPRPNYGTAKVSYALNISKDGDLLNIISLKIPSGNGKKLVSQNMMVPEQVTRSSGVLSNFMCDNSSYVLGFDNKGKQERSKQCFEAFKNLHNDILKNVETEDAKAILNFISNWNLDNASEHQALKEYLDDIYAGANFVFKLDGNNRYSHQDPAIKKAWEGYKSNTASSTIKTCLVTGEKSSIARLHPVIKGIQGGQAMGNSLISFNARAYESYGNEESQGLNSPVSEYAAFAYGTVLNKLLEDRAHRLTIGDSTVVFWAESVDSSYQDIVSFLLDPVEINNAEPKNDNYVADDTVRKEIQGILTRISSGKNINLGYTSSIDATTRFYILGLSPNAARISVRFFIQDSFGAFVDKVVRHYQDLAIEKQFEGEYIYSSIWRLLNETVSPNSKDKASSPLLSGSLMRAILEGTPYPRELFNSVMVRIRAERSINFYKAGIIKAYLLRCSNKEIYGEVLNVSLNASSTYKPYVLGRMFAIMEKAQQDANPKINATIKDRYFTSACATPASVFPVLLRLSSHHIAKAEYGYTSDNRLKEVMDLLNVNENPFPRQLTLEEQGIFILGYYHQKNDFYKKGEKEQ